MGRKHRIEYSGAIYHVIQRGNNKSYIFQDEEDNCKEKRGHGKCQRWNTKV